MSQTQILALVLAVVPAVFLVIYFYRKDKHPGLKDLIVKVFVWGIFSTIPAIVLELVASSFLPRSGLLGAAILSFLVAVLCEEWAQLLRFRYFCQ